MLKDLADACVALEEVGLFPREDAAFNLRNDFKDLQCEQLQ